MGIGSTIFGAVIGGIIGGPWGAVIGGGIGAVLGRDKSASNGGDSSSGQEVKFPLPELFICLGKLAKADGHVSEDEAACVRRLMTAYKLSKDEKVQMNHYFVQGRDSAQSFAHHVAVLNSKISLFADADSLRMEVLNLFCVLTAVDHTVSPDEKNLLRQAESCFGLSGVVDSFFQTGSRGERHYEKRYSEPESSESGELKKSYAILGIPETATDDEVKKAWRKKAQTFHPDHVQGAGLSAEFIEFAKQKMQEINHAYELIRKSRA